MIQYLFRITPWVLFIVLSSCNSDFTPRPRSYFNIEVPKKDYQLFNQSGYPYSFEYPVYANISKEVDSSQNDLYWINIDFKGFNGRIYLSYKDLNGYSIYKIKTASGYRDSAVRNTFEGLREEAYKMTFKHTVKSSGIIDSVFRTLKGLGGVYFYVGGDAATSRQFFLTDTNRHFVRGALYFDASPNADSISVVSNFLDADMKHLISTFRWNK
jgi:gliding motility-associated lipoprotein GldD